MSQMASIYADDTYARQNPDWHSTDSKWKASKIIELSRRNGLAFDSVAEVGCGAGHVLAEYVAGTDHGCLGEGFDIAEFAIGKAKLLETSNLRFYCEDFTKTSKNYDAIFLIDVLEHLEDYMGFMGRLRSRANYFIVHLPLEMHVSAVVRDSFADARASVGHLHFFTLGTALASLEHAGFEVADHQITRGVLELPSARKGLATDVANIARRAVETFSTPLAARLLGGYSVLALLRPRGIDAAAHRTANGRP